MECSAIVRFLLWACWRAGTGCSLMITDRRVVEQLCIFVGPSLLVLRFTRLFNFKILGHCWSAPCHTHHTIQGFFPRVCFKASGRFFRGLRSYFLPFWHLRPEKNLGCLPRQASGGCSLLSSGAGAGGCPRECRQSLFGVTQRSWEPQCTGKRKSSW